MIVKQKKELIKTKKTLKFVKVFHTGGAGGGDVHQLSLSLSFSKFAVECYIAYIAPPYLCVDDRGGREAAIKVTKMTKIQSIMDTQY